MLGFPLYLGPRILFFLKKKDYEYLSGVFIFVLFPLYIVPP
jgi:hypothetical protein